MQEVTMKASFATISLCLLGVAPIAMVLAPAALAQSRSAVDVAAGTGSPEFRDPKTGQVWTPETVGQDGRPIRPEDKAFDPRSQAAPGQVVMQRVTPRPVGSVPITAGPTVPIVMLENAALRALPGQRWQVVMYLNNNSANAVTPVVDCHFTNHGQPVSDTRAQVGQMGPGVRAGIAVMGPRVEFFVDRSTCNVVSP
jgi:hypothetical protein